MSGSNEISTTPLPDQSAFREALKIALPTLPGIWAWGAVVGIAMVKAGLTLPMALAMTFLVFAGTAQLASLPLLVIHAPYWVIILTALIINLRFVVFSALLAPHYSNLSVRQKFYYGYLMGDVPLALFIEKYPGIEPQPGKLGYLRGLVYSNWLTWQFGSVVGIFLGSQIPLHWGLQFAGTLALICIVLPSAKTLAGFAAMIVAGGVALLTIHWPYKLGLMMAVLAGMAVAMICEEFFNPEHTH